MLANGEWIHLDRNGEPIENSPLVDFLQKPNPFQKKNEWIIQQDIQKCSYGNCFIYILKGSQLAPIPDGLWNLTPKGMIINRTGKIWQTTEEDQAVENYQLKSQNKSGDEVTDTFEPREILHRNFQDPDDPIAGKSPFHALKMPISNLRAAYGFRNVVISEKGAIGFISNDSRSTAGALPLTGKERKELEQQFSEPSGS